MSSMVAHLGHAVLLLLVCHLPSGDVGLQTLVKIDHAGNRVGNGKDNEDDCDNRYHKVSFRATCAKRNFFLQNLPKVVKLLLAGL